jgi:hypothetical protein
MMYQYQSLQLLRFLFFFVIDNGMIATSPLLMVNFEYDLCFVSNIYNHIYFESKKIGGGADVGTVSTVRSLLAFFFTYKICVPSLRGKPNDTTNMRSHLFSAHNFSFGWGACRRTIFQFL